MTGVEHQPIAGVWGGAPFGSRGRKAPGRGSWDEDPRKLVAFLISDAKNNTETEKMKLSKSQMEEIRAGAKRRLN